MKIIVGLGNPDFKYQTTRHNAGFLAIDFYLKNITSIACQSKFKAQICELHFGAQKVFFVKPQTYMNLSGEAVKELCNFYKLNPETELLVLHDEVDLPLGEIRTSNNSSAAGHNGVQSIIDSLSSQNFRRIRIGVETRDDKKIPPTESFVLQNFTQEELKKMEMEIFPNVKMEIEKFIEN